MENESDAGSSTPPTSRRPTFDKLPELLGSDLGERAQHAVQRAATVQFDMKLEEERKSKGERSPPPHDYVVKYMDDAMEYYAQTIMDDIDPKGRVGDLEWWAQANRPSRRLIS